MVEDPIENQSTLTLPWPMRGEALYIKASLHEINTMINVFPTDIMRLDFYISKGGVGKPQSFSLSPKEFEATCNDFAVANIIGCKQFNVYCTAPTDEIVIRVTGGGEFLMETFECSKLLESLDGVGEAEGANEWAIKSDQAELLALDEVL